MGTLARPVFSHRNLECQPVGVNCDSVSENLEPVEVNSGSVGVNSSSVGENCKPWVLIQILRARILVRVWEFRLCECEF